MSTRELILSDLSRITSFAKEVVDADERYCAEASVRPTGRLAKELNETVRTSLSDQRGKRLVSYLMDLIEHLSKAEIEDLPGHSTEAFACMCYSLRAMSAFIARTDNPIGLVPIVFGGAVEFFDMLLANDEKLLALASRPFWQQIMSVSLKAAICVGSYQLTHEWLRNLMAEMGYSKLGKDQHLKKGSSLSWTNRERAAVIRAAREANADPTALVESVWKENELEFSFAAHFPAPFTGYANANTLRATLHRDNKVE